MPLHDWMDDSAWDGFQLLWIAHLFHAIKPQLPGNFRVCLGSMPTLRTAVLDPPEVGAYVSYRGRLVAALELISPRLKDHVSYREYFLSRYLGYLRDGAHLLMVDVHSQPLQFSFADALAKELQVEQPLTPAPHVVTYRVGEPAATGGRLIAIWRRPLQVGSPLPTMPLPLTVHAALNVDLEATYMQAAADTYLS
jgi:hypothetical protein